MRCYSTQLLTVHNVTSCRSVGVSASGRSDSGGGGHQLYCSFRLVIRKCARHVMEQVRILQRRVAAAIGVVSSVLWVRERERGVWITMAGGALLAAEALLIGKKSTTAFIGFGYINSHWQMGWARPDSKPRCVLKSEFGSARLFKSMNLIEI